MLNGDTKSGSTPFVIAVMLKMRKMKAELNEHRYYLEQKVEQRTEHLLTRTAFLESCNTALCDKLAAAQKELAALRPQSSLPKPATETKDHKLYVLNNQTQELKMG
jgi:hypothetical protein